jgi:hypothetical protein
MPATEKPMQAQLRQDQVFGRWQKLRFGLRTIDRRRGSTSTALLPQVAPHLTTIAVILA